MKRWFGLLAILLFFCIVFAGVVYATNYKQAGNIVKVYSLIKTQYLEEVSTNGLMEGAISGMVESLDDPYSDYLDADTYAYLQQQIRGSFGGLGILVGLSDDYLTVMRVYKDTPANKAGVRDGDKIVSIDGKDARNMDLETAVGIMRGPVGTAVTIELLRDGNEEPLKKNMIREEIVVPTTEGQILPGTDIAYVSISQFNEKTPNELKDILHQLGEQNMKAIILDLRNNPGGELIAAKEVANKFIPSGPIVHVDYRAGKDQTYYADDEYLDLPLVVLVNENSASASEIVAGAIKDTARGKLVGAKTFGKGIVQTVFPLDNGAALKLTTARYLTPNGQSIHNKGIKPDFEVKQSPRDGEDLQLKKAIEVVK